MLISAIQPCHIIQGKSQKTYVPIRKLSSSTHVPIWKLEHQTHVPNTYFFIKKWFWGAKAERKVATCDLALSLPQIRESHPNGPFRNVYPHLGGAERKVARCDLSCRFYNLGGAERRLFILRETTFPRSWRTWKPTFPSSWRTWKSTFRGQDPPSATSCRNLGVLLFEGECVVSEIFLAGSTTSGGWAQGRAVRPCAQHPPPSENVVFTRQ